MPVSASSALPEGTKGTPLEGCLRETHLNQGLGSAPQLQGHMASEEYVPGGATQEISQHITDKSLERPQGLCSRKNTQINLTL